MPNWCTNSVTFKGKYEDITKILELMNGETVFDFNKVIPYPETYRKMDEGGGFIGYNSGGYDWCREHWGTKWNAVEPCIMQLNPLVYRFDTAWSEPAPVISEIARRFPQVKIEHTYDYEGMPDEVEYTAVYNPTVGID